MASRNKTPGDPTGQRANRARSSKLLEKRLEIARKLVNSIFMAVPRSSKSIEIVTNVKKKTVYRYAMSPEQFEAMNIRMRDVIDETLNTVEKARPSSWWFDPQMEEPARQGTLDGLSEFNRLTASAAKAGVKGAGGVVPQPVAPEIVLSSQRYQEELRSIYADSYHSIKTLSDETAAQVIRKVNTGMKAGLIPDEISKQITERFDVAKSNADRIARTEVNKAFNGARLRATQTAEEISGLKAMVRHISALLPNRTRRTHAARHYLVYTVDQQNAWWAEDANLINCLCTTRTVIIDNDGNYIEA